jgi:hypothetical protein
MSETKIIRFSVKAYRDVVGGMEGPNDVEVVITGKNISMFNPPYTLVEGDFEDISGNDCAIVLKVNSPTAKHIVFVGMSVGSPYPNITTAKLAYVYF